MDRYLQPRPANPTYTSLERGTLTQKIGMNQFPAPLPPFPLSPILSFFFLLKHMFCSICLSPCFDQGPIWVLQTQSSRRGISDKCLQAMLG